MISLLTSSLHGHASCACIAVYRHLLLTWYPHEHTHIPDRERQMSVVQVPWRLKQEDYSEAGQQSKTLLFKAKLLVN